MTGKPTTRTPRRTRNASPPRALSDDDIIERIMTAIVEHRLPPGTKLGEDRLGEAFGVSRTRVRQVLFRLAAEKVVVQIANRGAFVAQPSTREAREVFDARRALESELAARLAQRAAAAQVAALKELLERERTAHAKGDRRAAIKLSGEFHLLIATLAGNEVLAEMLRELVARSSLIIAVHGTSRQADCGPDEHGALIEAIRRRDARGAAELMRKHLMHVESALDLREADRDLDLQTVFAGLAA